jgi:Ca2+-binding EF-hand superfamily protein
MYKKEQRQQPNFTQIKTAFDIIDLRKDGMIDLNEWTKSFGFISGNLDINENNLNIPNGNIFDDNYKSNKMSMSQEIKNRKILREWESSSDVKDIYKIILKHKKIIKKHLKKTYFMETNEMLVQSDNLVTILKEFLPEMKLSNTQWKMLVMIGKSNDYNLIDVDLFFVMIEALAKSTINRLRKKFK